MKREIVIVVRESGGVYHARYGKHSASASCSAAVAAARCGAKALGLCPSRKPADMRMRDYYRIVGQEASTVRIKRMLDCPNAYEAMHDDGDRGLQMPNPRTAPLGVLLVAGLPTAQAIEAVGALDTPNVIEQAIAAERRCLSRSAVIDALKARLSTLNAQRSTHTKRRERKA